MNECFTCGTKRLLFRYTVTDVADERTYYSCCPAGLGSRR